MACTIDHLAPGVTVRVLRDFTDLRGVAVPAGDRGAIQQLGLDWTTREIFIEWERAGRRETLRFPGRKTDDSPSNGNMRAFFEIEPEVVVPQPVPAPPVVVERKPARSDAPLAGYRGRQPPDGTNLLELRVACDCDPRLHRPVMTITHEVNVHACLRCGTVTCARCIGDEGRYTGDSWHAYLTVAIPGEALAWIAQWPRATTSPRSPSRWFGVGALVRENHHYLPADARCETVEDLAALEAKFAAEHASLTNGQRLRQTGFPAKAAPSSLPKFLENYAVVWRALQLRPDSPEHDLIAYARLDNPGSDVAADLLRQRPDHAAFMVECLRSTESARRSAGHALALLHPPGDANLAAVVLEILESLPMTPSTDLPGRIACWGRFEALLILIAELKLGTPAMLAALPALQRRLVRHDAEVAKSIAIVLRELQGLPPLPSGPFLP